MNNELTIPKTGYMMLASKEFAANYATEMDGLEPSFARLKIPSGGGIVFDVPNDETGEIDIVKEFSGVILFHHPVQAYYAVAYTGSKNPPDCSSIDGVTGTGNPGGNCATCPTNKLGTGANGGKACKSKRRLYILREGEIFPVLLTLPTGSLSAFTKYIMSLLGKQSKSSAVVTTFSLAKATNKTGVVFSQVKCKKQRELTAEEIPLIAQMAEQVEVQAKRNGYDADDESIIVDPDTGEIIEPLN